MEKIKFRSAFFDFQGNFVCFRYWGFLDHKDQYDARCFKSPATIGGCKRKYEDQFTGLTEYKHLDGKDVYDSDIIKNVDTDELQVVYWNYEKGAWYCQYIKDEKIIVSLVGSLGNLNEVIGNIHENPELLK